MIQAVIAPSFLYTLIRRKVSGGFERLEAGVETKSIRLQSFRSHDTI